MRDWQWQQRRKVAAADGVGEVNEKEEQDKFTDSKKKGMKWVWANHPCQSLRGKEKNPISFTLSEICTSICPLL